MFRATTPVDWFCSRAGSNRVVWLLRHLRCRKHNRSCSAFPRRPIRTGCRMRWMDSSRFAGCDAAEWWDRRYSAPGIRPSSCNRVRWIGQGKSPGNRQRLKPDPIGSDGWRRKPCASSGWDFGDMRRRDRRPLDWFSAYSFWKVFVWLDEDCDTDRQICSGLPGKTDKWWLGYLFD